LKKKAVQVYPREKEKEMPETERFDLSSACPHSNNIQRHAILQVIKKSQPHLKSISNVDETIKRITPVLKSNDQLARAITLR